MNTPTWDQLRQAETRGAAAERTRIESKFAHEQIGVPCGMVRIEWTGKPTRADLESLRRYIDLRLSYAEAVPEDTHDHTARSS